MLDVLVMFGLGWVSHAGWVDLDPEVVKEEEMQSPTVGCFHSWWIKIKDIKVLVCGNIDRIVLSCSIFYRALS